jgi:TonB family protein
MSQTVLLVDYEPRTVARVTEALQPLDCRVIPAKDVDAAVAACAKAEPRLVLITSVLPRLRVDDAITQLRAHAGLRTTPFVVLMSGYAGRDARADAARLGAQDILSKPFSNEELVSRVAPLLHAGRSHAAVGEITRADILEALRRTVIPPGHDGVAPAAETADGAPQQFTSEQLFGDLLDADSGPVTAETQRVRVTPVAPTHPAVAPAGPPVGAAPGAPADEAGPARRARPTRSSDTDVDEVLRSSLADVLDRKPIQRPSREPSRTPTAEQLLDDTLSGLQVKVRREPPVEPVTVTPAAPGPPAPSPAAEAAPPAAAAPLDRGTAFGSYELLEPIATGGMAEVYRARMRGMEGFEKIVAIKRILPHLSDNNEFVSMFIDEAKLAAQLQHPNIIHIYDLGRIERSYYIAMEYVDGRDLRSLLRLLDEKGTWLPLGLAILVGARLAAALDYAHRKHDLHGQALALVHRDISPQNILISYDGEIKLCDFGIAKAASKASHTRAGALKGKLQYMSPEQAWGKDIDHRSDIFSLGLVIYEMTTGHKAFAGDSELSVLEQVREPHITMPRDIDPAIPPQVERAVMRALRTDREERYQTAAEFASDLEGFLLAIRPSPSAVELGAFLAGLAGRECPTGTLATPPRPARPQPTATPAPQPPTPPAAAAPPPPAATATPAPTPTRTPTFTPPKPTPTPPRPVVAQRPPPPPPELSLSASGAGRAAPAARRVPMPLVAALAVVVLAAVGYLAGGEQIRRLLRSPAPTPAPESAIEPAEAVAPTEVVPPPAETPATGVVARPTPARREAPVAAVPTPAPAAAPTVEPTALPPTAPPLDEPVPTEPPPVAPVAAAPAETPRPRTRAGDLVDIALVDTRPVVVTQAPPEYPRIARAQRATGLVTLRALINERGTIDNVQVISSPRRDFSDAAVAAVRQYRYTPAMKDGVPVRVWHQIVLNFTLAP